MRRLVAASGAAILAVGLGAVGTTVGTAAGAPQASGERGAVALANDYIDDHRSAIKGAAGDAYKVVDTIAGVDGAKHVRYERTYQGLPVLGGDFVVHQDGDGVVAGASVAQAKPIDLSTTSAEVAPSDAVAAARQSFTGTEINGVSKPKLVVDALSGEPRLAWLAEVRGFQSDGQTPSRLQVLVNAITGHVMDSAESTSTLVPVGTTSSGSTAEGDAQVAVAGTGQSIYLGQVEIETTPGGSGFDMIDGVRGNGTTCDMNNGQGSCATFTDADNAWGDGTQADRASAGVDAHYGAALTFDYFTQTHGWNGVFGDGSGVPSRVHYGQAYVNAFWDGSQMTYGDGENNERPLVSLDVAGHEMSHGVTEHTAGLEYFGDAGGLNEATSDIFGSMVEFYANNAADPGDYDIGEKIDIFGTGEPLRYMYQPSLDGISYDCWDTSVPGSDPHYSSGVGNHFFFLLSEGSGDTPYGSSPTCDGSTLTGIGRDKASQIWFTALSQYMTSTETYSEARAHTVQAATDLYGAGTPEVAAVEAAWTAVSVS